MSRSRHLPYLTFALFVTWAVAGCATADRNDGANVDAGSRFADARPALPDAETIPACPTQPCDLHEQCGCPSGEACDLEFLNFDDNEFSDQLACRAIATPGNLLSTCASHTRCAAGYQCIGGQCRRYCQSNDVCGGPGGQCALTRAGSQRTDDLLCTKSCQPDFQADHEASCPKDYSCYIRFVGPEDNRRAVTDCLPTGPVNLNGDCSNDRCGEGLTCITFTAGDGSQSQRCQRRCRVADQTCPDGSACEGFDPPTLMEGTEYGICRSG
jgi:hypothetical protein